MTTHVLKIEPRWYEEVSRWQKNFEIRNCRDREFKVGDTLILKEWDNGRYTDRTSLVRKVEYVYKGDGMYGLNEGWCILGLKKDDGESTRGSYEQGFNDAKREIALSGEYERAYRRGFCDALNDCTNRLKALNVEIKKEAEE